MDHHRLVLLAVLADVDQAELVRQMEIDLDGGNRFFTAENVPQLNVQFRPVKRRLARCFRVGKTQRVHGLAQHVFGHVPHGVVGHVLLGVGLVTQRQPVGIFLDAQGRVGPFDKAHDVGKFFLDLILGAKNMRVVQRHRAHPAQSAHDTRLLVAVHGSQLGDANWQVAVAVPF